MLAALYRAVYLVWTTSRDTAYWWRELGLRKQRALGLLAVPLMLAVAAWWLAPAHSAQDEAARVFSRYTHRFPAGVLHDVTVAREGGYVRVCAAQGSGGGREFCAGVDLSRPDGSQ